VVNAGACILDTHNSPLTTRLFSDNITLNITPTCCQQQFFLKAHKKYKETGIVYPGNKGNIW
jgi:hypothetical protein